RAANGDRRLRRVASVDEANRIAQISYADPVDRQLAHIRMRLDVRYQRCLGAVHCGGFALSAARGDGPVIVSQQLMCDRGSLHGSEGTIDAVIPRRRGVRHDQIGGSAYQWVRAMTQSPSSS